MLHNVLLAIITEPRYFEKYDFIVVGSGPGENETAFFIKNAQKSTKARALAIGNVGKKPRINEISLKIKSFLDVNRIYCYCNRFIS